MIGSFFQLESFPIDLCFPSTCPPTKAARKVPILQGFNDPNCPTKSGSTLDNGDPPQSFQIRKSPRRGSSFSVCRPRSGLSTQGVSTSPPVHLLSRANLGSGSRVTTVTPPRKVSRCSQVSFPENFFGGFSPRRAHRSTQASGRVSDQHFAGQFPEQSFLEGLPIYNGGVPPVSLATPPNSHSPSASLYPFSTRIATVVDGLVKMGIHRDIAELYTIKDKPST